MENVYKRKCRSVLQILLLCLAMLYNALARQQTTQDASTLAEQAWRILERTMNTGNPAEQEAAVLALREVPGQHAKLLLRSAARSSSPQKRAAAIRTLGAFGELPDLPLIGTALTDSDSWVRMTAADALSHFQNDQVLPLLQRAIQDSDPRVVSVAYASVEKIGSRPTPVLVDALGKASQEATRWSAAGALGAVKATQAMPALRTALNDASLKVRTEAAIVLAQFGDRAGQEVLKRAAEVDDLTFKHRAAAALCEIGETGYLKIINDALDWPNERSRSSAIVALGNTSNCPIRPILVRALSNSSGSVRAAAIDVLARIAKRDDIPALRNALGNDYEYVRVKAALTLASLGDLSVITTMENGLSSRDETLRGRSAKTLGELGSAKSTFLIRNLITDPASDVKLAAIDAMVKLKDAGAAAAIEDVFTSEKRGWVIQAAASALISLRGNEALSSFADALESNESFTRIYAAGAILKVTQN